MKFDKEYISEADCPEIQNLREELKHGDWTYYGGNEHIVVCDSPIKFREFWVPTGDQLDDEIVKIMKTDDDCYTLYEVLYSTEYKYSASITNEEGENIIAVKNANPLLAKIKLLKELLNG